MLFRSVDGRVCVWDGATLALEGAVAGHERWVSSVGWSADGRVVTGGGDGRVCVFEAGEAGLQIVGHLELRSDATLTGVPSGYVRLTGAKADATWRVDTTLGGRRLALPTTALRPFFERPDLVERALAGEAVASTPLDDLRAAGWHPGPPWDGKDVVLHNPPDAAQRPPAPPPSHAATAAFLPGPALTAVANLPGRDELLEQLAQLARARTPTALLGPRRVGKTSTLYALASRLRDTFEVHHATLEGSQLASRDDLARVLAPDLRDHPAPAEALLRARPERPAIYLIDELAWLQRLPAEHLPWLRALGQHAAMVVFAGTHQDWRTVATHARAAPGSSFTNDVFVVELGPLATADALAFLVSRSEGRITRTVAELVIDAVGGWPFYLQVMGFALDHELRVGRPVVTRDQVLSLRHQRLVVDRDPVFAGRWHELPRVARVALLDHLDRLPRLDDLDLETADAILGAGLATPAGVWLDDIPFFQWVRLHARRLDRAEGR